MNLIAGSYGVLDTALAGDSDQSSNSSRVVYYVHAELLEGASLSVGLVPIEKDGFASKKLCKIV